MDKMDSNQYFEEKRGLLKECVTISEDILSNIADIDKVNELLTIRSEKIGLLKILDEKYGKDTASAFSENQKSQLDQIITLLLGLDRDTAKIIKAAEEELKQTMKVNTQNQKLINYKGKSLPTSGRILDKKK